MKLFGACLMILGSFSLIFHLNRQKKQSLESLWEAMDFIRNLTFDVTNWKLPLEEAVLRRTAHANHLSELREEFLLKKEELGIRKALLLAIENKLSIEETAKDFILYYASELGCEKKDSFEELYHQVQAQLEDCYLTQKEEEKTYRQLTFGTVGGLCAAIIILLL